MLPPLSYVSLHETNIRVLHNQMIKYIVFKVHAAVIIVQQNI